MINVNQQNQSPVGGDCYHTISHSIFKIKFQSFFIPIVAAMAIAPYSFLSLSARRHFMPIFLNGALETAPYGFFKENN